MDAQQAELKKRGTTGAKRAMAGTKRQLPSVGFSTGLLLVRSASGVPSAPLHSDQARHQVFHV